MERGDNHFLVADRFESLDDVGQVRAEADRLVQALSGSAALVLGARGGIKSGAVYQRDPGKPDHVYLTAESAVLHLRGMPPTLMVTNPDGTTVTHRAADPTRQHLAKAMTDPRAEKALRLRGQGRSRWVHLYRILEVVLESIPAGQLEAAGWATDNEIRRFKLTANSVGALGDHARHGSEQTQPPKSPVPLSEARTLIDRLLKAWLAL